MLLRHSGETYTDVQTAEILKNIRDDCRVCKKVSSGTQGFELTVGTQELRFNHRVQAATMYIGKQSALRMVDEAIHFCRASFLRGRPTKEIWKTIQLASYLGYLSQCDQLIADQRYA